MGVTVSSGLTVFSPSYKGRGWTLPKSEATPAMPAGMTMKVDCTISCPARTRPPTSATLATTRRRWPRASPQRQGASSDTSPGGNNRVSLGGP
jgi:hypothetical protein